MSDTVFGKRVKELRGNRTQQEVADLIGVPKNKWSIWELGRFEPKLKDIVLLCKTFSVSSDWLLGLPEIDRVAQNKTGGLKNNIRQIHSLAEKMTVKTNELLALTEEMEGAL